MSNQTPSMKPLSMSLASGITNAHLGQAMMASGADTANRAGNNARVIGKLVSRDKDGSLGAIDYEGVLRFPVKDTVDLSGTRAINNAILGNGDGTVKPVDETALAQVANARGVVVDFNNTDGSKWVDVIFP